MLADVQKNSRNPKVCKYRKRFGDGEKQKIRIFPEFIEIMRIGKERIDPHHESQDVGKRRRVIEICKG